MFKRLIKFLGTYNLRLNDIDFKRIRKKVFFIIISHILMFSIFFIAVNQLVTYKNLFALKFFIICLLVVILNLFFYIIKKNLEFSTSMLFFSILLFFSINLLIIKNNQYFIYWILSIPLLSYYLKGKFWGTVFNIIFLCFIIGFTLINHFTVINNSYLSNNLFNLICIYLLIFLISYFYETTMVVSEDIIKKQLYFDSLTNLPNRLQLVKDKRNSDKYDLLLINIGDFKSINNFYGSMIGDLVLIEISNKLKIIKNNPIIYKIYKLYADEFAILADRTSCKSVDEITNLAIGISKLLNSEINIKNINIIINTYIGISNNCIDILSSADKALKLAKIHHKKYFVFEDKINYDNKLEDNLIWIRKLENAIAFDNITPYFQPITNNINGQIEKYECLVRLLNEDEIIVPCNFLNIAKKTKLYPYITKMMVLKSFQYFKDKDYKFSINLSVDDINNKSTVDFISELLHDYNISNRVIFELIESENIEINTKVTDFINKMKFYGCEIAIDDFGTGYSNFDYILKLNVDYLKLDASLIKNIDNDKNSQIIIETIVDFSKKLKIKTIAEFVHSKTVYEKVKSLNIDYSQGYYLGKPEPIL